MSPPLHGLNILAHPPVPLTRTMYDVLFVGLRASTRRDDGGIISFILQMLWRFLMNFTLGVIGALGYFLCASANLLCDFTPLYPRLAVFRLTTHNVPREDALWGLVSSFQPDTASAVLFFALVAISAIATTATFLVGMYGAQSVAGRCLAPPV